MQSFGDEQFHKLRSGHPPVRKWRAKSLQLQTAAGYDHIADNLKFLSEGVFNPGR